MISKDLKTSRYLPCKNKKYKLYVNIINIGIYTICAWPGPLSEKLIISRSKASRGANGTIIFGGESKRRILILFHFKHYQL
jgi:hypothetical protein